MRLNKRFWCLLGALCLCAAVWFAFKTKKSARNEPQARGSNAQQANPPSAAPTRPPSSGANLQPTTAGTTPPAATQPAAMASARFPYRLTNTDKPLGELGRSDTAILLDNAFIDTASPRPLVVPDHLRSKSDPGSYIVQSRGPLDAAFYAQLRESGAEFVSYVPNDAALVRAPAESARTLTGLSGIRAVLPYEPYYKLAEPLLATAVEQQTLPLDRPLNVTLFPGQKEAALAELQNLGADVTGEELTPFGPMLTINPRPDSLEALAQLPEVQRIEFARGRTLLNDLSRVRLNVAADTSTPTNYLELTGTGVTLNINDTGVDKDHPDLTGRVFFSTADTNLTTATDVDGHGTHVAGTIISSGGQSSTVRDVNGNPPSGSDTNATFRGMAPEASLFVLPIDLRTGPVVSDTFLQRTAASNNFVSLSRTNAVISNNSWAYNGAFEYNFSSANYDAAVRDALPDMIGSQPILYVFAAGNSGFGSTNGTVGEPDSIPAPATAKNVITVGAIESLRNITNEFYTTNVVGGTNVVTTNAPFLGFTDNDSQVASFSSRGNVGIGTEGEFGRFKPDLVAPGTFVVSTRSQNLDTNNLNPLVPDLGGYYRYDSGTSMSAPAVSGTLALMQQFFEQKLKRGFSPALMKALLINGARSVNPAYDFSVTDNVNFQGWGLANLTNSLPAALTNSDETTWPIRFFDQSPTNAIATGQRHTWNLKLSEDARSVPLRVTLVWTDPPGNPGVGIKLVNDLDLIVTNLDSGAVFAGNAIPGGFDFNQPIDFNGTNASPFDFVNNVENIFLKQPLGTNYSITVVGRRVNVNAVTANTNDVVQDYALVVSSGNGEVTNAFASLTRTANNLVAPPGLVSLTNGLPLLKQRVGANFQLSPNPNGDPDQWRFYVFTNAIFTNATPGLTNGSNVAFITFLPPDLSRPRNLDADIDLYVSYKDPTLLSLNPTAISNAIAAGTVSRNRGGTEVVAFTNAVVGSNEVYYIGVKSEDQQGAEFGIVGLSTDIPFDEQGENGSRLIHGLPPFVEIPDGAPDAPGAALMFGVGIQQNAIARVTVTNDITHESIGDLLGNLSHQDRFAVLNNHNRYNGTTDTFFHLVYDDSGGGQYLFSRPTDGPGNLNNFVGEQSAGVWLLVMTDDARGGRGRVDGLTIRVDPQQDLFGTNGVAGSVLANQWTYYFVDVPVDATKLTITLSQTTGPLNLYLKRGAPPTATDFDKSALIDPTGGSLSIGLGDVPPLNAGRYFIGVFNPNAVTVTFRIRADIVRGLAPQATGDLLSTDTPTFLLDDAISRSSIFVPVAREIADIRVGVRIDDPRASDLVLHLVSPQGTRVLLTENRGSTNTLGYGVSDILSTNTVAILTNSFENAAPTNYFAGDVFDGWTVVSNSVSVRADRTVAADATNFLVLRGGEISRVLPTTAGRTYRLSYAYRLNSGVPQGIVAWWPLVNGTGSDVVGNHGGVMSGVAVVPGMVDGGFGFDGVTSVMNVPDAPALDLTGDYSLEFWVNPDPIQNPFANIVRKEDPAGTNGFGIEMDATPGSNFYYAGWKNGGSAPGDECWTTAGFQLTPGVWQHVAVVKSNATRFVYINGNLVNSATCVGTTGAVEVNNAPLQFGAWNGRANSGWRGVLDEMSLYNRALTQTEIDDIVVAGNAGKCGSLIPPVTCSSGAEIRIDGNSVDIAAGFFSWLTHSISFTAARNGTVLDIAPVGAGMLLDNFVLIENQVTIRPSYTVFTDDTNFTSVPIKFADPPFTNSMVVTSLTNNLVVDDGFENATVGPYSVGQFVSGWQVSTGQVQVFDASNPFVATVNPPPAGITYFQPRAPGKRFLVLNGAWDSTNAITNWVAGGVITNFNTTAGGQYVVTFLAARDPTLSSGAPVPPDYPTNPPVLVVLTNGAVATNMIVTTTIWQTNTLVFQPNQPVSSLEFRSFTTNGVFLDVVQVTALDAGREAYFQPEETLKPFIGENAFGPWTLEMQDNRVGLPTSIQLPLLLSWKLDFVFANTTPPAITLTNCDPFTNVVSVYDTNCAPLTNIVTGDIGGGTSPAGDENGIRYFIVDVPRRATMATNILEGSGDLVLLFNQDALPTGTSPGDYQYPYTPPGAQPLLVLSTNGTPPLLPGQRYYLGVANANPGETNTFTLSVAFDQTDTSLISVLQLTNGLCYSNTIPATNALDYYQFDVSTNASAVTFQLTPQNGNVDLIVRKARPVPDPLPRPVAGEFDYLSQNPGTNVDEIIVTTNSQPVALSPGIWYLGVFNSDTNPVSYSICATESAAPLNNIIRLTNDVPLDFTIAAGSQPTNYFLFTIDQTNAAVSFSLYNLDNPADLLVDLDVLPSPTTYLFSSSGSSNSPTQIIVDTNGFLSDLNGDWYLAVENLSSNDLNFTILASLSTNAIPTNVVVINPTLIITNGQFCLSWNSVIGQDYHVEAKTNLTDVTWTTVSPTITATDTTTTWCIPITGTQMFFRVVQGAASTSPTINFTSLTLTPGGFVLNWTAPVTDRFNVQYATNLPPVWMTFTNIITSTNGNFTFTDDGSQSGGLGALRFYRLLLLP